MGRGSLVRIGTVSGAERDGSGRAGRRIFCGEVEGSSTVLSRKRTLCGDCGGSRILSSGSSGTRIGSGSDTGAADDVSLSPDSLTRSSVVFGLRRLTTRVFFLRMCERECRPAPSPRPLVAECMLTSEGREGRCPCPSSEPLLNVYVVEVPSEEFDLKRLGVAGVELPAGITSF